MLEELRGADYLKVRPQADSDNVGDSRADRFACIRSRLSVARQKNLLQDSARVAGQS